MLRHITPRKYRQDNDVAEKWVGSREKDQRRASLELMRKRRRALVLFGTCNNEMARDHVLDATGKLNLSRVLTHFAPVIQMSTSSPATALTSLLNSLHTHLQTHTQLLPTLHAQLGLPPSALEDDLKVLQEQLVQSVELQIDRRRKEVDGWMHKCDELEKHCLRYTQALGGNIKATGTSLGELKKEQALPRRYERISEHQEKLRQASSQLFL